MQKYINRGIAVYTLQFPDFSFYQSFSGYKPADNCNNVIAHYLNKQIEKNERFEGASQSILYFLFSHLFQ